MDNIKPVVKHMIYLYKTADLPRTDSVYSVIRKTIWSIADPYHVLLFIKSGQCQIHMENHIYQLKAGDVFYMPPNTQYTRMPFMDDLCEIYYVHFEMRGDVREFENSDALAHELLKQEINDLLPGDGFAFLLPNKISFGDDTEELMRSIFEAHKYRAGTNVFSPQTASFALCSLLSYVSRKYISYTLAKQSDVENKRHPEALRKALSYIRHHYTEPISLDDLCNAAFISKQMLIRHFNKVIGKSPTVYIIEYKINCIKPMLTAYPEMSIKEITSNFGFKDQCYFSRLFKKYTGESPTEYRERVMNFNQSQHISESTQTSSKKDA